MPKSNFAQADWQPSATLAHLRQRASILAQIRQFFAVREVLEVETPLLCRAGTTDLHVHSLQARFRQENFYLQTSPEFAMKRLLAAGSGAIYQICKAFREDQPGVLHQPEFTLLEWYRPGFDHHQLMAEMDTFLQTVAGFPAAEKISHAALFRQCFDLDPHRDTDAALAACVQREVALGTAVTCRNDCLDLLLDRAVAKFAARGRPLFVYDFPQSQAALAKLHDAGDVRVASRFEVYVQGIELANGFHELQDPAEQRERFVHDLLRREKNGLPAVPVDERFLAALHAGLPDCAGVALGVDRLLALVLRVKKLAQVMSFDFAKI